MSAVDVLVIGGGPAGMSAAVEAAGHGLDCCVIDEGEDLGGQIYRSAPRVGGARSSGESPIERRGSRSAGRRPKGLFGRTPTAGHHGAGDTLRNDIGELRDRIEVRSSWVAWGIFEGRSVAVSGGGTTNLIEARSIVLAPGAYEYVPPFPGWTLPGVMTPGGSQILAKTMGVVPGKRILVAGTGPFLLASACEMLKAGANVVGVLEASPRRPWLLLPLRAWRVPRILSQGLGYLRTLSRAGVPVRYRRMVVSASGEGQVERVCHAAVDDDWRADMESVETEEVDTLCIGYGFIPRVFLAQMAGCEMTYEPSVGGWMAARDADMCTTVPNVFAVGDGAGVAGVMVALLEGKLAGLVAAHRLGAVTREELQRRRKPLEARMARLARVRRALDEISRVRPGLSELAGDDTMVCRCEELCWRDVRDAVTAGETTFRTLKVSTRLGMGPCQGRYCWPAMARRIALEVGCRVGDIGAWSPRPPIRPVRLADLAAAVDDRP